MEFWIMDRGLRGVWGDSISNLQKSFEWPFADPEDDGTNNSNKTGANADGTEQVADPCACNGLNGGEQFLDIRGVNPRGDIGLTCGDWDSSGFTWCYVSMAWYVVDSSHHHNIFTFS